MKNQPSAVTIAPDAATEDRGSAAVVKRDRITPGIVLDNDESERTARLLIISDEDVASELLLATEAVGFDYDICTSAEAAAVLAGSRYHAAIVSIAASDNAFAVIGQARSISSCRQVPIVAIVDRGDINSAFRAGASFAIPRPITINLVENTLGAIHRLAVGIQQQYARYRVELPVTLSVDGHSMEAKATNIGTGGIAVVAEEPLQRGTAVSVRFLLPGSAEQIHAAGKIRWTDHQNRAGLAFSSIAGGGQLLLENWIACRNSGTDITPPPRVAPVTREQAAANSDVIPGRPRSAAYNLLIIALLGFCLFILGFWAYLSVFD